MWEAEAGVQHWYASRATAGGGHTSGRLLSASTLSTVFDGLSPGTSYTFHFWWYAPSASKWHQVYPSASCTTDFLAVPANLGCSAGADSVILSWDRVAGADGYVAKV